MSQVRPRAIPSTNRPRNARQRQRIQQSTTAHGGAYPGRAAVTHTTDHDMQAINVQVRSNQAAASPDTPGAKRARQLLLQPKRRQCTIMLRGCGAAGTSGESSAGRPCSAPTSTGSRLCTSSFCRCSACLQQVVPRAPPSQRQQRLQAAATAGSCCAGQPVVAAYAGHCTLKQLPADL